MPDLKPQPHPPVNPAVFDTCKLCGSRFIRDDQRAPQAYGYCRDSCYHAVRYPWDDPRW